MSIDTPHQEPWETDDWQWFYEHRQVISEADWLSCPNPGALLDYVNQTDWVSRRKFFLAAIACIRRVWHLLDSPELRAAVQAAECYAEGAISQEELLSFREPADAICQRLPEGSAHFWAALAATHLGHDPRQNHGNAEHTMYVFDDVSGALAILNGAQRGSEVWFTAKHVEMRFQADLYRCVMGNPFRRTELDLRWLTLDVVSLARGIYEQQAFDRLPILADALLDAGCDDEAIQTHCHDQGPHARGCWVIDLVLGLE